MSTTHLQTEIICLDFMKRVYEAHVEETKKDQKVHSIFGADTTETVEELINRYTKNIAELQKRIAELVKAVQSENRIMVL
jgi:16S rRNA G1207 methylase RsmC